MQLRSRRCNEPETLPFQTVDRIAGRVRLRHGVAGEVFAPVVVVALRARQVELALALVECRAALIEEGLEPRIVVRRDRFAARLHGDVGRQRQHLLALVGERLCLLILLPGQVDALLEVHRAAGSVIECRVARRDALHAGLGVAVAIRAGFGRSAGLAAPQGFAVEHRQHSGIAGVVVLHRLVVAAHVLVGRAAFIQRDFRAGGGQRRGRERQYGENEGEARARSHSTVILAEASCEKPLSPVHWNANVPLSVATVWNVMNGLAAMA